MKIRNIKYHHIDTSENDIVVYGEGELCEKAADIAAAQYRPCILVGASDRYPATKYEPLYLDEDNEIAIREYIASFEYVAQLNGD